MALEIERKFLVKNSTYKELAITKNTMRQGFLNLDPLRTVRVRIAEPNAWLTIKGKSNKLGTTRYEWETTINIKDAEKLLQLREGFLIEKCRYTIKMGRHFIEVDEFYAENQGLVVAEIELESEDEKFLKPAWLGKEVTGEIKYYNSQLSQQPFNTWKQ